MSLLLGLAGTVLFSRLAGVFIFTWPVALFSLFGLFVVDALPDANGPEATRSRILRRAMLASYACVCLGYCLLCGRLFIVAGQGFVVGLLPALPVILLAARKRAGSSLPSRLFWDLFAFSVFFWSSGLFTVWKTHT